jgi:hypothetical protein
MLIMLVSPLPPPSLSLLSARDLNGRACVRAQRNEVRDAVER